MIWYKSTTTTASTISAAGFVSELGTSIAGNPYWTLKTTTYGAEFENIALNARMLVHNGAHASSVQDEAVYGGSTYVTGVIGIPTGTAVTSPTTGDPYSLQTSSKALHVSSVNFPITSTGYAAGTKWWFAYSEDMLIVNVITPTGGFTFGMGKLLVEDTGLTEWVVFSSRFHKTADYIVNASQDMFFLPMPTWRTFAESGARMLRLKTGQTLKEVSKCFAGGLMYYTTTATGGRPLENNNNAVFMPIPMAARDRGSSLVEQYIGHLKQIKYGPPLLDRQSLVVNGVEQSIFMSNKASIKAFGLHLDQVED